jgi:hypothetical protein
MKHRVVANLFLVLVLAQGWALAEQHQSLPAALLAGAWQNGPDGPSIRFEPGRILVREGGQLTVRGVESGGPHFARVRKYGKLQTWSFSLKNGFLHLKADDAERIYRHLEHVPPQLVLEPIQLGMPKALPEERVKQIQAELTQRLKTDQAVRKDPARGGEMKTVDAENTRYLEELAGEVGWIDAERFGVQTSANAVILAKHSSDLPLVLAILPAIERDFKKPGAEGEVFSVLYDGLQIDLGRRQRFGTQLDEDSHGEPMVLQLENIAKVEEYRKALGLPPLSEYLATASNVLYDGKPIRMPRADE